MKTVVVICVLAMGTALAWANWPIRQLPVGSVADRVLVTKHNRTLTLYQGKHVLAQYRISLGRNPVGAKEQEGDKKTPEGTYRITEHKADSAFHRALRVSYPELKDRKRAELLNKRPGSDIMVHGMRNGFGFVGRFHLLMDWTAGCIAVTNKEIDQIYATVPDGTVIDIHE